MRSLVAAFAFIAVWLVAPYWMFGDYTFDLAEVARRKPAFFWFNISWITAVSIAVSILIGKERRDAKD